MNRSTPIPAPGPDCARYADALPLCNLGLLDATQECAVRAHVATCPHCAATLKQYDRVDALLRAAAARPAPNLPTVENIMDAIEEQQNPLPPAETPPGHPQRPQLIKPRPNRAATVIAAIAAVLVIALLAQALLGRASQSGTSIGSHPNATATPDATETLLEAESLWYVPSIDPPYSRYHTPQQAFQATGTPHMCLFSTTLDQTVTWLATGPASGLVLVQAHCSDGRAPYGIAYFIRTPDATNCSEWEPSSGLYSPSRPLAGETIPANALAIVPSWLPLPEGPYENASDGANNEIPDVAGKVTILPTPGYGATIYLSTDHLYAITRYQGPALRPTYAHSVSVNGSAGWYVTDSGMTVITVPLSSNETFSFAGNGMLTDTLPLAKAALAHLDEVQPKMSTTDTVAPQFCK